MELPFFLKSLFTVFIFSTFPSFRCEDDENFKACDRRYGCGEIKNLTFPFWGDDRPQICGNAGFELSCKNREYPVIDMDGLEYRVLNVSQENRVTTLARPDLWDTPCSRKVQNTTLNKVFFPNYTATVENLTFIYDCPENELLGESLYFLNNFTCSKEAGSESRISYYVRENLLGTLNIDQVGRVCNGGVVQVPASRTALDEIERSAEGGVEQVTEVLRKGFDAHYMEFPVCSSCENSGGICGSNNSSAQFSCYCPDGTEHSSCLRKSGNGRDWKLRTTIGIVSGGSVLLLIFIITCCLRFKVPIKSWKKKTKEDQDFEEFIRSYRHLTAKRYRFLDVKSMTKSFKDKLGQGGYGEVYKGKLLDGRPVAVKVLNASKGKGEDFINEVESISRTSHVNIVTLLGFCIEGRRKALIYEFMPNGSLEKFIYNPLQTTPRLEWEKLLQICIGIARGLEYLHRGCNAKILHLDIKPHNILLDEDLCPKISDFGLAKLCPRKNSVISMTNARGTIGYIAPEVLCRNFGGVSSKSDVYSYGMMILEMVGARNNIKVEVSDTSEIYFPDWIYKHIELNSNLQLWGEMTSEENEIARKMILVGLWCIQSKPLDRPSMSKVIEMLNGSAEALHIPPNPSMFSPRSPERFPAEPLAESSTTSVL